ncbi:hypothetical protein D3C87_1979650 [compost metagenome]
MVTVSAGAGVSIFQAVITGRSGLAHQAVAAPLDPHRSVHLATLNLAAAAASSSSLAYLLLNWLR